MDSRLSSFEASPAFAELVGGMPPGLPGSVPVGLQESLMQRGQGQGLARLGDTGQGILIDWP
ncbi:hypothetical protein [Dankookia sp. GCM10030260]|uniref:hypothetical protein n=1 Tax=Dankookia sp. GCM10030260 TaxID=3273390 RepID=UPI0038CFDB47